MYNHGYDYFIFEPGKIDEMYCNVCNSKCDVSRSVMGPTSFSSALAHKHKLHDCFICPNSENNWHHNAYRLIKAIEETPSKRLAGLMQLDLEDILNNKEN